MYCEIDACSFLKSTNQRGHIAIFKRGMFMSPTQFDKNMVCVNIIGVCFDNIFKCAYRLQAAERKIDVKVRNMGY